MLLLVDPGLYVKEDSIYYWTQNTFCLAKLSMQSRSLGKETLSMAPTTIATMI